MKWENFGAFFILTSLVGNILNWVFLKRVSLYLKQNIVNTVLRKSIVILKFCIPSSLIQIYKIQVC
jgi:hypothetical protein